MALHGLLLGEELQARRQSLHGVCLTLARSHGLGDDYILFGPCTLQQRAFEMRLIRALCVSELLLESFVAVYPFPAWRGGTFHVVSFL